MVAIYPNGNDPLIFAASLPEGGLDTNNAPPLAQSGTPFKTEASNGPDPTMSLTFVIFDYPDAANRRRAPKPPLVELRTGGGDWQMLQSTSGSGAKTINIGPQADNQLIDYTLSAPDASGVTSIRFLKNNTAFDSQTWDIRFTINDGTTTSARQRGLTFVVDPGAALLPWLAVPGQQQEATPPEIDLGAAIGIDPYLLSGPTAPAPATIFGSQSLTARLPIGNYGPGRLTLNAINPPAFSFAVGGASTALSLSLNLGAAPREIAPGDANYHALQVDLVTAPFAFGYSFKSTHILGTNDPLGAASGERAHINSVRLAVSVQQRTSRTIRPIWTRVADFSWGEPGLAQGLVIFGEMGGGQPASGAVRAVRLSDGVDVWNLTTVGNQQSNVCIEGGIAYLSADYLLDPGRTNIDKSTIYAVDIATGLAHWQATIDGRCEEVLILNEGIVAFTNKYLKPAPSTDEDIHYLALLLDKQTGTVSKTLDLGPGYPVATRWNNQIAIVRRNRPWIETLDPTTWTTVTKYTDAHPIRSVSSLGDHCYIATSANAGGPSVLSAVSLASGQSEWTQSYSDTIDDLRAQGQYLAVATQLVPGGTGKPASISLLDIGGGAPKWTAPAGSAVPLLGPIVGSLLTAQIRIRPSDDVTAITIGFDVNTGEEFFRCELPYSAGWLADAGNNILVGSHLENVFALDLNNL